MRRSLLTAKAPAVVAAFVANHTGAGDKAVDSALDLVLSSNVAAGNTLFASLAFDNGATGGQPAVTTISVPGNETAAWSKLGAYTVATGTGGTAVVGELWVVKTTVEWASSFVPVVTIDITRNAKAGVLVEFSGVTATQRGSVATNTSTTSVPSATNTAPLAGDLVVAASGWETGTAPTGDADTTNGSWSTIHSIASTGGLDQSNVTAALQYKIVTATGSQTYNPTNGTSTDAGVVVSAMVPG